MQVFMHRLNQPIQINIQRRMGIVPIQTNIIFHRHDNYKHTLMKKISIICILIFTSSFIFCQTNKPKQTDSSKPFALGLTEEMQSVELVAEILLKNPTLFNKYIIISPSLWWDNGSLLNQPSLILNESFSQKIDIYIGVGKEGLTPSDIPHVMEVDPNLLAEKIKNAKSKNVTTFFDYLPQEDHATIGHQAIYNAMKIVYSIGK
jgi:hypothetical protein